MYRYIKATAAMAISAAIFLAPGLCAYADNDYLAGTNPEGEMETTTSNTVTVDYVGNFVYENGTLTRILFEGGYVDMAGSAPEYMFYLTDHLGNVRVVADSEGNIAQVNHYYPYGDRFSDSRYALPSSSTSSNDRLFGGKELDSSSGLHDFEARYDNTLFGRFTTMDPMAEKYYGISPYSYCAGNPLNLVDPDGCKVYFAPGTSDSFKEQFAQAVQYMNKNGTSYNLAKLESLETVILISETANPSRFTPSENTVKWNPTSIARDENDLLISPVSILAHELAHALHANTDENYETRRQHGRTDGYKNDEEFLTITTTERYARKQHGELFEGQPSRSSHNASEYKDINTKGMTFEDIMKIVIGTNKLYYEISNNN